MNNTRAHLFISGRVQGVFFRHNTYKIARELLLTGWVKNLSDGRVEVVIEGAPESVTQMISWCRTGKQPAEVSDVEVIWEDPTDEFISFETIY